uniref:Uncharacterized protein n=1 Tax=Melanopsichium pennsylvanicum 4 TaxID=1398559 RepID=A0A077R0V3_9BASI|nr:uncharacterized protein BN887_06068 [Melanopsichium pennsylvanicum 4]
MAPTKPAKSHVAWPMKSAKSYAAVRDVPGHLDDAVCQGDVSHDRSRFSRPTAGLVSAQRVEQPYDGSFA